MAQVVELLPSKYKALSSNSSTLEIDKKTMVKHLPTMYEALDLILSTGGINLF
jgi:hypothetical protein